MPSEGGEPQKPGLWETEIVGLKVLCGIVSGGRE